MRILHTLSTKTPPHPVVAVLAGRRLTVAQLAAAIGYSREHTSCVVHKHKTGSHTFHRLCSEALGLPESELFDDDTRIDGRDGPRSYSQGRA